MAMYRDALEFGRERGVWVYISGLQRYVDVDAYSNQ